jgi:hypothetical protein
MKDLELAKKILCNENLTIALVKEGRCIYKSDKRGIYPLYMALLTHKEELKGASAADKVVGRGAAKLYECAKVKNVYSKIISEGTKEVFEKAGIEYETEKIVPYIKNREQNGMCPIESISYDSKDTEELMNKIEAFLKGINLL